MEQESSVFSAVYCGIDDEDELTQTQSCNKYQSTQKQKVDTDIQCLLCATCTFMLMNWHNVRKSKTTHFLLHRSYILDSEKQFITHNINIHQVFLLIYTDSPSFSTALTMDML